MSDLNKGPKMSSNEELRQLKDALNIAINELEVAKNVLNKKIKKRGSKKIINKLKKTVKDRELNIERIYVSIGKIEGIEIDKLKVLPDNKAIVKKVEITENTASQIHKNFTYRGEISGYSGLNGVDDSILKGGFFAVLNNKQLVITSSRIRKIQKCEVNNEIFYLITTKTSIYKVNFLDDEANNSGAKDNKTDNNIASNPGGFNKETSGKNNLNKEANEEPSEETNETLNKEENDKSNNGLSRGQDERNDKEQDNKEESGEENQEKKEEQNDEVGGMMPGGFNKEDAGVSNDELNNEEPDQEKRGMSNKTDDNINNQESSEEVNKRESNEHVDEFEKFKNKGKNIFDNIKSFAGNKEIWKQLGKTTVSSLASILGLKGFYDVPAYIIQKMRVSKNKTEIRDYFGDWKDILDRENDNEQSEKDKNSNEGRISSKLDKKIKGIKDKIDKMKISDDIKEKLSNELEGLIKAQIEKDKKIKEQKDKELKNILDEYLVTKISGAQATRELLNTACVAGGAYALRGISYGAISGIERYQRLKKEASEKGEKVKLWKNFVIDGVNETFSDLRFKGDGTKVQKSIKFIKALGVLGRFTGITLTFLNGSNIKDFDQILDVFGSDKPWQKISKNFVGNISNYVHGIGKHKNTNHKTINHNIKPSNKNVPEILKVENSPISDRQKILEEFKKLSPKQKKEFLKVEIRLLPKKEQENLLSELGNKQHILTAKNPNKVQMPVKAENFEITNNIKAKNGDSVWSMAKKYLNSNKKYQEILKHNDKNTQEALQAFNIDKIKDVIIEHPEKYGLRKGVDWTKMSKKDLNSIKWQKAFNDVLGNKKGGFTNHLSSDKVHSILESNKHHKIMSDNRTFDHKVTTNTLNTKHNIIENNSKLNNLYSNELIKGKSASVIVDNNHFYIKYIPDKAGSNTGSLEFFDSNNHLLYSNSISKNELLNGDKLKHLIKIDTDKVMDAIEKFKEYNPKYSLKDIDSFGINIYDGISPLEHAKLIFLRDIDKNSITNSEIKRIFNIMNKNNLHDTYSGQAVKEFMDKFKDSGFNNSQIDAMAYFNFINNSQALKPRYVFKNLFNVKNNDKLFSYFDNFHITNTTNGFKKIEISKNIGGGIFSSSFDIYINTNGKKIFLDGPELWNSGSFKNPLKLNNENLKNILKKIKYFTEPAKPVEN